MQTCATTTRVAQTPTSEGCCNMQLIDIAPRETTLDVSASISPLGRRKSTLVDTCAHRVIAVIWIEEQNLKLKFVLNKYLSKWQTSGDGEWAAKVGLLPLFKGECWLIRAHLRLGEDIGPGSVDQRYGLLDIARAAFGGHKGINPWGDWICGHSGKNSKEQRSQPACDPREHSKGARRLSS